MPGIGHTTFQRGKKILVILKDGNRFVARYDRKSDDNKSVLFQDHDTVALGKVRVMSIYRGT